MDVRRFILALTAAFAVYAVYMIIYSRFRPAPRPATANGTIPGLPASQPAVDSPPSTPSSTRTTQPAESLEFTAGKSEESVSLGGAEAGDSLWAILTPRGAALSSLRLTERRPSGQFFHQSGPRKPHSEEPYELLSPVTNGDERLVSFATSRLWITERNNEEFKLDQLIWDAVPNESNARRKVFRTTLVSSETNAELLTLTKTYALGDKPLLIYVELEIENHSDSRITPAVEQAGPIGIHEEGRTRDMCRLLWTRRSADSIVMESTQRPQLIKLPEPRRLDSAGGADRFLWAALTNKYFGVFTRPIPTSGDTANWVSAAFGELAATSRTDNAGDLRARIIAAPGAIEPGKDRAAKMTFEIYAGPKDSDVLARINPAFVNPRQLHYDVVQSADQQCACTFQPLPAIMTWLLETIYSVVRNYGVAIIILVIIVRSCLHKLAVFQQKSMYRMQESMARVQPKLEDLKERYANDKVRLNQEIMKLWAEENVNPAAGMVAFVPIFLQMPILVALWTALNGDIHLRNAPFDGWWIADLSAPDAIIDLAGAGYEIPILHWPITSINLLPILMGISMWLQQKYMPKPAMAARMEAAKNAPPKPKKPGQLTPEEQMRQQQMIANIMSVLFPLMFYYMPSGLNLYWMATNVFGICESLIIRKQLEEEKKLRAAGLVAPPKPRKPGFIARAMKSLAQQAEELQRKADEATEPKKKR